MNFSMIDKQKYKLVDKLAIVLGITSTMPILGVPLGGRYITLFTVSFILFFIVSVFSVFFRHQFIFTVTKNNKVYLLFLLWPILSYVVGLFYMPDEWYSSMSTYIIKVIEYLIITIILYLSDNIITAKAFAKGLVIGIILNSIWSILEAVSYYFFSQSLNDAVFGKFINLDREILLWNSFGGIRVSGFNYDPAHLGGLLPILLCYGLMKRNIYITILTFISLAFSQSTTALVGCMVVFFLFLMEKRKKIRSNRKFSLRGIIVLISAGVIITAILVFWGSNGVLNSFVGSVFENIEGYIKRINNVYVSSNNIEPRQVYYTRFIGGLIERGPFVSLTGSGLGTSMYPFRNITGLFSSGSQTAVTEIETNYIAYLFDLGIIGLAFYIIFLYQGFKKMWKIQKYSNDSETYLFLGVFVSIICCSALYHYIFTAYQILAFSFATIYIEHMENKFKLKQEFTNVNLYYNTQKVRPTQYPRV